MVFQSCWPRVLLAVGLLCFLTGMVAVLAGKARAAESLPGQRDVFERRIRPVLAEKCYPCHSAEVATPKGGLRLDSAEGVRRGGDSGPAVVSGKPEESLLIAAMRYQSYEMPPDGRLPDAVVSDFVHWVETGAFDPRTAAASDPPKGEPSTTEAEHWAFHRPVPSELPVVHDATWVRTDIDRFILARLEQDDLSPSRLAEPRALLRRVSYDLIGLPPTAEEVDRFAANGGVDYEAVVDRLLASPHFGERWGRHWLDVARYADTKGYVFQEDRNYPKAYTYRDWIIRAFNENLPYDRFVVAQLAADQLDDLSSAPAMGFLTLGRRFINNKNDIIDDRIDVVTRGLMGLTVTCARCHDHKYDPISTADYYALYGVFDSSREPGDAAAPLLMVDEEKPREPVVFVRGNPSNRGPQVPRRFLACLSPGEPASFQHGSGRREMAAAIASPDNPLTARVWVNRVWLHLFGRGLVTTPSDFGRRSDPPSHRGLLDHLACRFIQEGWSTKWLIREMVLSSVYRQASDERPECAARDSENRLWWRTNRRRLDLESLRDSLLVAAGRLDTTMSGPSVQLTELPFAIRRSVYGFIERQNLPSFFRSFDFAGPDTHSPGRPYTTVPQQALFMMNSPFALEQALHLASRDDIRAAGDDQERIRKLFRCALGREPCDEELAFCSAYVRGQDPQGIEQAVDENALWQFGWGRYDAPDHRVQFQVLPHFTGTAWQGGKDLPDPQLGWVMLTDQGGHPGNDPDHAVIRRWTAPRVGTVSIGGTLEHPADRGDGVLGQVIRQQGGLIGEFLAQHGKTVTTVEPFNVDCGEMVDFVVDCRGGPDSDSFAWTVTVSLESPEGTRRVWDSSAGFRGPLPDPLNRWHRVAQVLLMSNEFVFVD